MALPMECSQPAISGEITEALFQNTGPAYLQIVCLWRGKRWWTTCSWKQNACTVTCELQFPRSSGWLIS